VLLITLEENKRDMYFRIRSAARWVADTYELGDDFIQRVEENFLFISEPSLRQTTSGDERIKEAERIAAERSKIPTGAVGLKSIASAAIEMGNVVLIIIDPRSSFFSDPLKMNPIASDRAEGDLVRYLASATGATVLVVDHTRKDGAGSRGIDRDVTENTSGTAQRTAAAETIIQLVGGIKVQELPELNAVVMKLQSRHTRSRELILVRDRDSNGYSEVQEDYTPYIPENRIVKQKQNGDFVTEPTGGGAGRPRHMRSIHYQAINMVLSREGPMNIDAMARILNEDRRKIDIYLKELQAAGKVVSEMRGTSRVYSIPGLVPPVDNLMDIGA
jgi:hypothetical protein